MTSVTVNSLMEQYQLQDKDLLKLISDDHLQKISQSHCMKWKFLPSYLKMERIVAEDIDRKYKDDDEKRFAFFNQWKESRGSDANYRELISALLVINSRKDAEEICKLLQKSLPAPAGKSGVNTTLDSKGKDKAISGTN